MSSRGWGSTVGAVRLTLFCASLILSVRVAGKTHAGLASLALI